MAKKQFEIGDIVQVQANFKDIEYVGLLGYISEINSEIAVDFYYAKEVGQNAYVITNRFKPKELFFCGRGNPELIRENKE